MSTGSRPFVVALLSVILWIDVVRASDVGVLPGYTLRHTISTDAKPATVWRLWDDVENWKKFDTLLEYSYLEEGHTFVTGAKGVIKARGNMKTRFELVDVDAGVSFTEKLKVPLWQTIELKRYVGVDAQGKTRFTHEVVFKGRLRFLIYAAAAKTFKKELPLVMARLKDVAELEDENDIDE